MQGFLNLLSCCLPATYKYDKLLDKEGQVAFLVDKRAQKVIEVPPDFIHFDKLTSMSWSDTSVLDQSLVDIKGNADEKMDVLLVKYVGWKGCVCPRCLQPRKKKKARTSKDQQESSIALIEDSYSSHSRNTVKGCLKVRGPRHGMDPLTSTGPTPVKNFKDDLRERCNSDSLPVQETVEGTDTCNIWERQRRGGYKRNVSFDNRLQVAWTHAKCYYTRCQASESMVEAKRNPTFIWQEIKTLHTELFPDDDAPPAFGTRPDFRTIRTNRLAELQGAQSCEQTQVNDCTAEEIFGSELTEPLIGQHHLDTELKAVDLNDVASCDITYMPNNDSDVGLYGPDRNCISVAAGPGEAWGDIGCVRWADLNDF